MKISIVVVTWRSRDLLASCLESLADHAPGCEIVVVDNASGDGTAAWVRQQHPAVQVLEAGGNLGFAAGCNLGAAQTSGDLLLFLNPDIRTPVGSVQALADALAAQPTAAAAGGLLVDADGAVQPRYAPRPLPSVTELARNLLLGQRPTRPRSQPAMTRTVGQVAGACFMVRRADFRSLGGFDTSFQPVFFEDVDICRRLERAGRDVLHVGTAAFVHGGGGSVRRMSARSHYAAWFENLLRYAHKHHGGSSALLLRLLTIPGAFLRLMRTALPGSRGIFGRRAQAGAFLHIAFRNMTSWRHASQSTS